MRNGNCRTTAKGCSPVANSAEMRKLQLERDKAVAVAKEAMKIMSDAQIAELKERLDVLDARELLAAAPG
jgi:hypothetical protein